VKFLQAIGSFLESMFMHAGMYASTLMKALRGMASPPWYAGLALQQGKAW